MDKRATWDDFHQIELGDAQETPVRKTATQRIDQKSSFLDFILESLPHPFYVIDASTHKIVVANTAAKKLKSLKILI